MWYPEGYTSWHEVFSELIDLADEITSLVCSGGEPTIAANGVAAIISTGRYSLYSKKIVDSEREADVAFTLFAAWLTSHFLAKFPPVAADLSGNIIHLHPVLLGHREQFEYCSLGWPMTRTREFSSYPHDVDALGFAFSRIFDRFNFIDVSTGFIRPKNGTREHLINCEGFSEIEANSIVEFASSLRQFTLCWQRMPSRFEWREFLEIIEIDERFSHAADYIYGLNGAECAESESVPLGSRRGGRPRSRDRAATAYMELFPEGHGELSWKDVVRRLDRDRSIRTNVTSIKRGLADLRQNNSQNPEQ